MGLSEINSKNYDIILDKVKSTPVTPVTSSSMSEYSDSTYNIKTEIEQQQKHLSNNEVLEIISKYKAGKSTYELAKEYGCHRRTISDNLKKRGIKVTNQLMERKGVVELVMQMYSEYYKPADIAKAVGINVDSVRKILSLQENSKDFATRSYLTLTKFLIIGNKNAITYKEFFPLLKDNKVWIGYNNVKEFRQPDGSMKKFGNIGWYTNLDIKKRHEELVLYKKYTPEEYPKYDNYDAINVDKVSDIPHKYRP